MGCKNCSFFRVCVMDIRKPRDGRVLEEVGWYDPRAKQAEKQLSLKRDRVEHWLALGAQPSETVGDLLKRNGIAAAKPS